MNSLNTQNSHQAVLSALCFLSVSITSADKSEAGMTTGTNTHLTKVFPATAKGAYCAKLYLRKLVELSILKTRPIVPVTFRLSGFTLDGAEVTIQRQPVKADYQYHK